MATAGTVISNSAALHLQMESRGIPVGVIYQESGGDWFVSYRPSATPEQISEGNALAAAFDGQARVYRPLWQIYQDLSALTGAQLTAIWTDLSAGSPPKYLKDVGPNVAGIFALDWAQAESGATGASLLGARKRVMAMAVQDYPFFLDHPAFDETIVVLGVEPVAGMVG